MANKKSTVCAWAALAGTILLAGCSREEGPGPDDGLIPVTFSAGITGDTATGVQASLPNTRTTAGGNEWTNNDQVGIFMLSAGGSLPGGILNTNGTAGSGTKAGNLAYDATPDTPASTATFITASGTPMLYYPRTGEADFIAYYPYGTATAGSTTAGTINTSDYTYNIDVSDQNTEVKQNAIDLLYAKAPDVAKSKTAVALQFDHVMSKVTFDVKAGEGFTATDIDAMTGTHVVFTGMPVTASMDLANGTVTGRGTGDFSPLKAAAAGGGAQATFTAILVPQAASEYPNRTVTFSVGGQEYVWPVPGDEAFRAGNHYTYPVTVRKTGIAVGTATIAAWDEEDSGSGELFDAIPQPEANSYMVRPGGAPILIPISQANKAVDTNYNLGADATGLGGVEAGNFTVELVWGDSPVKAGEVVEEIQLYGKYVYVKPGPTEGNMVIAIRDNTGGTPGNIKWSWHIWVTEPVTSKTDTYTGLTWMDRNLGAKSNTPYMDDSFNYSQWVKTLGLFYQWGRKDAFPGGDGSDNNQTYYTKDKIAGTTDHIPTDDHTELFTMVQSPLSFAINANNYYGSINAAGLGNKSWSGYRGEKTLYDPCPPGWKVPPISVNNRNVWGIDNAGWPAGVDNGRIFDGGNGTSGMNHYYPASGIRYSNGWLGNQGMIGRYWSATSYSNAFGYSLYLDIGDVTPALSRDRTHGLSVRCVADIN